VTCTCNTGFDAAARYQRVRVGVSQKLIVRSSIQYIEPYKPVITIHMIKSDQSKARWHLVG
jgi:hypothetical protein